jgi:sugar/nucleoside kinase (ribokinase family)
MTLRVVCMGQLLADVIAVLHEDLHIGSDTSGNVTIVGGGAGSNVAAWMGSEGEEITLVSRVGNDVMGRALIADIEDEGVTTAVSIDDHVPTGSVVVLVTADGERSMIPDAGASARIDTNDIAAIGSCDLFYLSGYLLLHEGSRAVALQALRHAKAGGAKVAVDVASAAPISAIGADLVSTWFNDVDCLLANVDEATALTGENDPWAAARQLQRLVPTAVVKRGKAGAIAISPTEEAELPAQSGVLVIDTVGAGDSFAAGFLPAWSRGAQLADALTAGTTLAARCIAQLGARPTTRRITT